MLFHKVEEFINIQQLISRGNRVLIAVSGGADSVFLLHCIHSLAQSLGIELAVAHFNHSLRGLESQQDAVFVKDLAESLGLEFFSEQAPSGWNLRAGISLQAEARRLRYEYFQHLANHWHADRVALGHHADDLAETVFWHLIRGSGPAGLRGIPARRGIYIRPLLGLRRWEVESYLQEQGLPWREDSSNASDKYTRNRIRHQLIPLVESFNPRAVEAVQRTANILALQEDYIESQVLPLLKKAIGTLPENKYILQDHRENNKVGLKTEVLNEVHYCLAQRVIQRFLQIEGFHEVDFEMVKCVLERLKGPAGIICQRDGRWLIWHRGWIFGVRKLPWQEKVHFHIPVLVPGETMVREGGGSLRTEIIELEDIVANNDNILATSADTLLLDMKRVDCNALIVRSRLPGDRFFPVGMDGSKKLKDLFIDLKIERALREKIPVLCMGENILWVVGLRGDRRYLAGPKTKKILRIHWKSDSQ